MIDSKGTSLSRDCFERARAFRAGLAPVMKNGCWGFIESYGTTAIPFAFDDTQAQHFKSGLAAVKVAGKWGFIDRTGSLAIKPYFEEVRPFAEGLAPVKFDGQWGMLDLGGGVRLRPKWDELEQLSSGLAAARINGKFGYINPIGDWAIDPVYNKAKSFFGELALVHTGNVSAYVKWDGQVIWEFEPHAIVRRPPIPLALGPALSGKVVRKKAPTSAEPRTVHTLKHNSSGNSAPMQESPASDIPYHLAQSGNGRQLADRQRMGAARGRRAVSAIHRARCPR
jgi:hypothetical protein